MADGLATFDPWAKCPKCGHDDIAANYHDRWGVPCRIDGEHIDRRCRRCGYGWAEAVVSNA